MRAGPTNPAIAVRFVHLSKAVVAKPETLKHHAHPWVLGHEGPWLVEPILSEAQTANNVPALDEHRGGR